jgi:hypothetical protein
MKLKVEEITIQSGGVKNSQKFGIRNIGFILSILRSKMYRSPIEAICREISSNCIDANRLTGKQNIPIEIKLPNSFNSNIEFKDFGPGIDLNLMEDIFLNYGESSKRLSNEDIGGFGLGAKTPFSYSDVFNITTIAADRVKRTYAAIIDQSQQGELNLLSETSALESESTGTTVSIPIKKEDFKTFTEAVIKYTKYWSVRPKLSGQTPPPEYPALTELISGSNWKIFDPNTVGSGYNDTLNLTVIIAGVPFEIDLGQIKQSDWPQDFWKKYGDGYGRFDFRRLREIGLHLYIPNGELTIAASRDSLYFDDETRKKLAQYITQALSEIADKFNEKLNSFPSYREANLFLQNIYSSSVFYQIDHLLNSSKKDLEWQGKKLHRSGFSSATFGKYAKITTYQKTTTKECGFETLKPISLNLNETTLLIHDDTLKTNVPATAITKLFSENADYKLIQVLFTPQRPNNAEWRREEELGSKDPPQYQTDVIQNLEFEKLTEALEGNFRRREVTRKSTGEKKIQIYEMISGKLKPKKVNPDEIKGYYIDIRPSSRRSEYSYYLGESFFIRSDRTGWFPKLMEFLDLSEEKVYFLLPKTSTKISNLVSIEEKLKEKLKQVDWKLVSDVSELSRKKYQFESVFREFYSDTNEFQTIISKKIVNQKQSLLCQFVEKYNQFLAQEQNLTSQIQLFQVIEPSYLRSLGYDVTKQGSQSNSELDVLVNKINAQYPMLFRNNLSYSSERQNFVARYINLMDWIKSQPNLSLPFTI